MAGAFLTALVVCLIAGGPFIRWLRARGLGESFRKLGPERRQIVDDSKEGTPTMGGLLTIASVLVTCALWCDVVDPLVLTGLGVFVAAGCVGLRDDWLKCFHTERAGMSLRVKLALLSAIALAAGTCLLVFVWGGDEALAPLCALVVPFTDVRLDLGVALGLPFLAVVVCVVCGTANAVNLTDGMDGLAAGCLTIACAAFVALAVLAGSPELAARVGVATAPGADEIAVLLAAVTGAALGFLRFNVRPARVFMGDIGSLSFGAVLGYAAVAIRMELALFVIGGVFVAEALSVIVQVTSYRLYRKRVFLCAPVHHHFQKQNVPESTIVARFWCAGIVFAVLPLVLVLVGVR